MAAEGDDIIRYTYRGEEGEIIPREATHIVVLARVIPSEAFRWHGNIVEVICHEDVEKIETAALANCYSLRRVVMPGVKIVKMWAFSNCPALTDVECEKLEMIGEEAFSVCESMRSIDLPSAEIVVERAFADCKALTDVKFGSRLERIEEKVFLGCTSLERITFPMKDGIIDENDIFQGCCNLKYADLVEGKLQETIAALHLHIWRNDMNREIDSINRILPITYAGYEWDEDAMEYGDPGQKAWAIRAWIRSVLRKIIHYQAEHRRVLNEAATTLQLVLPQDIAMNNVLPFLELPAHWS